MIVNYGYQLFETGRRKSARELRSADARRGEFAAALSRSLQAGGAQVRGLAAVLPGFRSPDGPACASSSACEG
jgi:hypothetical protein